jgi:xylulokinase
VGEPLVLGVDSSTQSTKAELRTVATGRLVARASAPHPPVDPPVSEQDPEAWWAALESAVDALGDHRRDVVAVSVAGQQHGLVLLGDDDRPLRPAPLWNDTTSAPDAERLVERLGPDHWAEACGSVPVASFTVTKLARLAAEEPGLLERVARVMLPHDYLTFRLTGEAVTDRGDASGTGWWSPNEGRYRSDLLDAALGDGAGGAWLDRLPTVLGPEGVAGALTAEASARLGLSTGIPVGPGTGDNMAAALGLGLGPGDLALSLGTSGTVYTVSDRAVADTTGAVAGFADATGRFLPLVCTLNATRVTDVVAGWLGTDFEELGRLADAPPVVDDPVLVPYLAGERTPNLPEATGSLFGISLSTDRATLARSAHTGVVCGLLQGIDALRRAGCVVDGTLSLVGGGAMSPAYRSIVADLWGAPIRVPEVDESVAAGACVQAAAIFGDDSVGAVSAAWDLGVGPTVEPRAGVDADGVRAAYAEAAAAAAGLV